MSMFLTSEEVAELTGIKRGRNGQTRNQLQIAQLRSMHIAFYTNASGRPIVARVAVEGGGSTGTPKKQGWSSAVFNS